VPFLRIIHEVRLRGVQRNATGDTRFDFKDTLGVKDEKKPLNGTRGKVQ